MDILESKSLIIEEVNKIINSYHLNENKHSNEIKSFTNEVQRLNKLNQTLSSEIASKDKLLCINEQKTIDYENMINQIQEDALKETTEKERFDMLKAQDKEIHLRDQEIIRLQKRVDDLENKLKNNSNERLEVDKQLWKMQSKNSYFDDPKKVKIAIEGFIKHTGKEKVTIEDVGETSIGINGWYDDSIKLKESQTLVEKMKDITEKNDTIKEEIKEIEVIDSDKEEIINPEKDKEEVIKEIETEVIEEEEEDTSEDELEVEIITHYKKEYYIKSNEKDPQYIYAIDDGELGVRVGEIHGKKKIFYQKKKG